MKGFVIAAIVEIAFAFIYGFWLQDTVSVEMYLVFCFCFAFITLLIFRRKEKDIKVLMVKWLVLSFVLSALSVNTLLAANRMSGKFVGSYDVTVTQVIYRFGGTAYFTNNSGEERCVDLHDFWIIRPDDHDFVEAGDTVKVKEYVGLFGKNYYVLVADEK